MQGKIVLMLALVSCALAATTQKTSADDVHLNAVLPEAEVAASASASSRSKAPEKQLELTPQQPSPTEDKVPETPSRTQSYFGRLISGIFEIPISVLQAVRDLLNTAAKPIVVTTSTQP